MVSSFPLVYLQLSFFFLLGIFRLKWAYHYDRRRRRNRGMFTIPLIYMTKLIPKSYNKQTDCVLSPSPYCFLGTYQHVASSTFICLSLVNLLIHLSLSCPTHYHCIDILYCKSHCIPSPSSTPNPWHLSIFASVHACIHLANRMSISSSIRQSLYLIIYSFLLFYSIVLDVCPLPSLRQLSRLTYLYLIPFSLSI